MMVSLRGYWTEARSYQKFLYLVGAILLASAVFHAGVLLATRGTLAGDVSWRKPILFGESFGLTAWSIAWFLTYLPQRPVVGWLLAGPLGIANVGEVFLVATQQWRGVPSHFNHSTPFDEGVFVMMGLLILVTGVVIVGVTLLTLFAFHGPASIAWAARCGMLLLVAGQLFGVPMISRGTHTFGVAGNMKIPHALALHGAQILPLLAWLLIFSNWSETRRTLTVLLGTASYAGLVAVTAFQAFRGLALLNLNASAAMVLVTSLVFFLAAYVTTLRSVRQRIRQAPGTVYSDSGSSRA